jgi:hypothetical protein
VVSRLDALAEILATAIHTGLTREFGDQTALPVMRRPTFAYVDGELSFDGLNRINWRAAASRTLGANDVWDRARAAVDELLRPEWRSTSFGGDRRNAIDGLLVTFVERALRQHDQQPTPDALLAACGEEVGSLRAFCTARTVTAGYAIPVAGILIDQSVVEIGESYVLRQLSEDDARDVWAMIGVDPRVDARSFLAIDFNRAASVRVRIEQTVDIAPGDPLPMETVQHGVTDAINLLRLATGANVHMVTQHFLSTSHPGYADVFFITGIWSMRTEPAETSSVTPLLQDYGQIRTLHARMSVISGELPPKKLKTYNLALGRFASTFTRARPEDRILDSWIGLEALLLDEHDELSYKISMRLAALIGHTPDERMAIFTEARKSYRARSRIAHGSSQSDVVAAADSARELLRRALVSWMAEDARRLPDELDEAVVRGISA